MYNFYKINVKLCAAVYSEAKNCGRRIASIRNGHYVLALLHSNAAGWPLILAGYKISLSCGSYRGMVAIGAGCPILAE